MSTTIDQRVVEMRFDNQQFERNVQTSMSTLDKLKEKLHLKGASKGLEEVNSAAKKCNLSPLGAAVEGVKVKFSAMEVMAVTALSNITNSAVNAGKRMIKALTIDPVTTGFNEYETQINAVQTILANTKSKGTTLDDVNSALDELNAYADKTIYNFTEMTRNIGTFTAAGVDLDTSVNAIQGIANLAAVSGSTSQQASTAMYQLSQALAAGTVKLTDWNSVVNAGMGGEVFQEALKKTSAELKTGAAEAIKAEGSFRESLKTGWLTSEVLTETLKKFTTSGANEYVAEYTGLSKEAVAAALEEAKAKYGEADAIEYASKALAEKSGKNADEIKSALDMAATAEDAATKVKTFSQLWDTLKEAAQSGWTQTWELLVGDFEEAKELLTGLSDFFGGIIQRMSDARNKVLEGALGKTFSGLSEKLSKAFSPVTKMSKTFTDATTAISKLGTVVDDVIIGKFGNGQERYDALTKAGQNYYLVQNKVNETLGNTFHYTDDQIEAQNKLLGSQKETTDGVKEETGERVKLSRAQKNSLKNMGAMTEEQMRSKGYTEEQIDALKELGDTANKLGMPLGEFINKMDEIDGRWLLIDSFKSIGKGLIEVFNAIGKAWQNVFPSTIDSRANTLFNIIAAFHKFSREVLTSATKNADKLRRTFEGLFAILDIVRTIAGGGLKIVLTIINSVLDNLGLNILDVTASIGDCLVAFRNWIKNNEVFNSVIQTAANILTSLIIGIKNVATAIYNWVKAFMATEQVQSALKKVQDTFSSVFESIKGYFGGLGTRMSEFIERVKALDGISLNNVLKVIQDFFKNVLLIDFGAIFSGIFNGIKDFLSNLRNGASAGIGYLGEQFDWLKGIISGLLDFLKKVAPAAGALAIGLGMLKGMQKIGDVLEVIARPLEGISDVLEGAGKALNSFSGYIKAKAFETKANAVLKLAISLGILTACIIALTLVDSKKIWESVGALGALMGILAVFTLLVTLIGKLGSADPMGVGKSLTVLSVSMLGMAISLSILVGVLKNLETLDPDRLVSSLAVLAGLAVGLVALSIALSRFGGKTSLSSAVAMIAMVLALKMMVGVLNDLGDLDLGKSLVALGLLFGIVASFKILLRSCSKIKASAAIALIGTVLALKMVVGVIATLGMMDFGVIIRGLAAIIPIFAMFSLVMIASKFAGQHAAKAGVGILAMSVAIMILVGAIKLLSGMSESDLEKGLKCVSTLLAIFGAIVALSAFAGKNAIKAGVMLLMMSGAILILTGIIWLLQGVSEEGLQKAVGAIASLGLVFAVLIAVSKLASSSKGTIFALTVAIIALATVLVALSMLDGESLTRATIAIDSMMAVFAMLIFALGTIKTQNTGKSLASVLALTLVVAALASVLAGMTYLPNPNALLPSAEALSVLLLTLSAALIILSKIGTISKNAIGSAYAVSGVMVVLGGILSGMSLLANATSLLPAAESLSILLIALSASLFILSKVGTISEKTIGSAYAVSGVMVVLGAILSAMSLLPNPTSMLPIAEALSLILLALSAALLILSKVGNIAPTVIGAAYAVSGVMVVLGGILSAMSLLPNPTSMLPIAEALSLVTVALAAVCAVLSIAGVNVGAAAQAALGFAAFIGIFAALLLALGGLKQIPGFDWLISEGSAVLSSIGYALGDFVGSIIGGIGAGITSGLPAMADNLSAFMEKLTPFIEGAKSLDNSVLQGVGYLAAAVLALTAADLLQGLTSFITGGSSLSKFGDEIAAFGPKLKAFSDGTSGINPDNVTAAANAAKALAEMANTIPNEGGIAAWFAGENSVSKFGEDIAGFGVHLKEFSDGVSGINPENVTAAANAGKALAEMASTIPNEGGVAAWFAGENSISKFGVEIAGFGIHLKAFSDNVAGINPENVTAAANAGKALAEMASTIPNEGGVAAWFAGENSISKFGTEIAGFGTNMKAFSDNVSGINPENIKAAADAGKTLAEMTSAIPNEGGVVSWFAGENSLAKFGTDVANFGTAMKSFSDNVTGINPDNVTAAANAGKTLAEMTKTIPNEGGVVSWFAGDNSLAKFGTDVANFGTAMKSFSDNVSGINPENVTAAANAGKALAEMTNTVPNSGGVSSWFGGEKSLAHFGEDMVKFGTSMKSFSDNVAGINPSNVTAAANAAKSLAEMTSSVPKDINVVNFGNKLVEFGGKLNEFQSKTNGINISGVSNQIDELVKTANKMAEVNSSAVSGFGDALRDVGNSGIEKFTETFNGAHGKAKDAISNFINAAKDAAKSKLNDFYDVAKEAVSRFIDGLRTKDSDIKSSFSKSALEGVAGARGKYTDYKGAGSYLVDGFASGISGSSWKATNAGRTIAQEALRAAKASLGIASPSKEFYKIGAFTGDGFVNALDDYSSKVYYAGAKVGDEAKAGLSRAIAKVSDMIESGMDTQPTIRPVIDLSDVEAGANSIGGMFDLNPSVGVLSNVQSINSAMNSRQNGMDDRDLMSAIKDLGAKLGTSSGDTYSINGITYDDGSNISSAVKSLVRAARVERRI